MWLLLQVSVLAGIAWFDFKDRLIPIMLYLTAFGIGAYYLFQNSWQWLTVLLNMSIGLLQVGIVAVWLKIRNRQLDFFNDAFGWGDVLMLLVVAFYLMPMQYVIFIIVSCLLSIAYALTRRRFNKEVLTIPLAGIMAVLLIAYQSYVLITETVIL